MAEFQYSFCKRRDLVTELAELLTALRARAVLPTGFLPVHLRAHRCAHSVCENSLSWEKRASVRALHPVVLRLGLELPVLGPGAACNMAITPECQVDT